LGRRKKIVRNGGALLFITLKVYQGSCMFQNSKVIPSGRFSPWSIKSQLNARIEKKNGRIKSKVDPGTVQYLLIILNLWVFLFGSLYIKNLSDERKSI